MKMPISTTKKITINLLNLIKLFIFAIINQKTKTHGKEKFA